MNPAAKYPIGPFVELGRILQQELDEGRLDPVIRRATEANCWFTAESVAFAIRAICSDMLQPELLETWLRPYQKQGTKTVRRVGIIMAGNIPLVGFFDLMCVLLSGHGCLYKPSSKDSVLIDHIAELLTGIDPSLPLQRMNGKRPDAVIATGSDNTNRYFRTIYHDMPALFRGSRHSIAVLTGDETPADLTELRQDIFTYFGMGCRNVSQLFLPRNYDTEPLMRALQKGPVTHPPYLHNYRQAFALNTMQGKPFTDGGFFLLREGGEPAQTVSELACTRYDSLSEVEDWLSGYDSRIQCVVSDRIRHPRRVRFGQAQHPAPTDYPDGIDVMKFLLEL